MFKTSIMHLKQIRKAIALASLFSLSALSVGAGLKFEQTVIEDVVSSNSKVYPFEFTFTNTGNSPVKISEVKTSCGCTTAKLEKMVYEPGENGVIQGKFSIGDRKGLQQKNITILTTDLGQPSIKLGLSLKIPQLVSLKPGLLFWELGAQMESQTLVVIPNHELNVKVESIEVVEKDAPFEIQFSGELRNDGSYEIHVKPLNLDSPARSLISIKAAPKDTSGEISTFYAHAIIK